MGLSPKEPNPNHRVVGPKYYNINGIWAPEALLFGSLDPRGLSQIEFRVYGVQDLGSCMGSLHPPRYHSSSSSLLISFWG